MTDRILDRLPSKPDPIRSARYNAAPIAAGLTPRSYTWRVPFHLDQRDEGACVAHAWTHEAVGRPVPVDFAVHPVPGWARRASQARTGSPTPNGQDVAQAFAFDHYERDRQVDEWPGEAYDGTSVSAGAKTSAEANLLGDREYRWADNVDDLAVMVSRKGPAVLGLDWPTGFWNPDGDGFLRMTGRVEGGHSLLAKGYSLNPTVGGRRFKGRRAFLLHNSWSERWGIGGDAWIDHDVMGQLLESGGEAAIPLRRIA